MTYQFVGRFNCRPRQARHKVTPLSVIGGSGQAVGSRSIIRSCQYVLRSRSVAVSLAINLVMLSGKFLLLLATVSASHLPTRWAFIQVATQMIRSFENFVVRCWIYKFNVRFELVYCRLVFPAPRMINVAACCTDFGSPDRARHL